MGRGHEGGETEGEGASVGVREQWSGSSTVQIREARGQTLLSIKCSRVDGLEPPLKLRQKQKTQNEHLFASLDAGP